MLEVSSEIEWLSKEQGLELRRWRTADFDLQLPDYRSAYVSSTRVVAIGACGRSGTTLLRLMLGACPDLVDGPESHVFLPVPVDLKELSARFNLSLAELSRLDLSNRWRFIDEFQRFVCARGEGSIWVDKTSRNVHCFSRIAQAFPNAILVHMVRDPRDAVASLRTHPKAHRRWSGETPKTGWIQPWNECIERWRRAIDDARACNARYPIYEVRYEDLVTDPMRTLRQLTTRIGIRCPDEAARPEDRQASPGELRFFPNNHAATQRLTTNRIGRWRQDLPGHVVDAIEELAGGWMDSHGYR